jgi:hypothetical protein
LVTPPPPPPDIAFVIAPCLSALMLSPLLILLLLLASSVDKQVHVCAHAMISCVLATYRHHLSKWSNLVSHRYHWV